MRFVVALMLALALPVTELRSETVALVGADIHTLGAFGTITSGSILIEDGIVRAIGKSIEMPASARIIDVSGKVITPGLYDPVSYLGAVEISLVEQTVDHQQKGDRYSAAFDVSTAINPRSTLIPINRIEGVVRTMVAPAPASEQASVISGLGTLIHLGDSESYVVLPRAALFAHLGETGARLSNGSRATALMALREALEDARDYDNHRGAYNSGQRRDYSLGRYDLQALQAVLRREIPLVLTAHRASDIEQALTLAIDEGVDLVVLGGSEAWMIADKLAAVDVPVILDPTENLPSAFERLNAGLDTAARLHKAGVRIAFSIGESHNASNIRQLAGNAVAHGLPWEQALRAITIVPATLFGDPETGALETGKTAELVVWSGDPLEVTTAAEQVYINGRAIPMRSRQTLLRDRYMELDVEMPHAYRKP